MRIRNVAVAVAVIILGAAGCDAYKQSQGTLDAPISRTERNGWAVLSAPDGYPNIATRCYGTNGIYVARQNDGSVTRNIQLLPNDPNCGK